MRIGINKMQAGGGLPFTYYQPVTVTDTSGVAAPAQQAAAAPEPKTKETKEDKGFTVAALLDLIKSGDGLASDLGAISQYVMQELGTPRPVAPNGDSSQNLARIYMNVWQHIKEAKLNKDRFEKIEERLQENGGIDEIAITKNGRVVAQDAKGEIRLLTPEEYNKYREAGRVEGVSNYDLLKRRLQDPRFAFDQDLMGTLYNGVGMGEVTKYIQSFMKEIGESTQSTEGISTSPISKVKQGLEFLDIADQKLKAMGQPGVAAGLGIDGLYKSKVLTKEQASQAAYALEYLYKTMPTNYKTLLKTKAGGTEDDAIKLISNYIASGLNDTAEFSTSLLVDAEGQKLGSNGKKSGGDGSEVKSNTAMQFVQGLGQAENIQIFNGTNDGITALANSLPVDDGSGKLLGNGATIQEISQSQYGGILNMQSVTMGGELIQAGNLNKIMTDGMAHGMDLPIDTQAAARGIIKPDLKLFAAKEAADQEIRQLGIADNDYVSKNRVYAKHGLNAKYDSTGQLRSGAWARFAVFNGTALDTAFGKPMGLSKFVRAVDPKAEEGYASLLAQRNGWKDNEFKYNKRGWWDKAVNDDRGDHWYSSGNSFYEGTVFIPMIPNAFNALAGTGTEIPIGKIDTNDIEALEQQRQRLAGFANQGSWSD